MKTVLVVDDEHEIAEALRAVLEDEGYQVEVFGNGRDAIERLEKGPAPALLISDVMMPIADGLELLEHVRKQRSLKATPVVLMSAARPRDHKPRSDLFLRKPFSIDEVLSAVHRLIGSA